MQPGDAGYFAYHIDRSEAASRVFLLWLRRAATGFAAGSFLWCQRARLSARVRGNYRVNVTACRESPPPPTPR